MSNNFCKILEYGEDYTKKFVGGSVAVSTTRTATQSIVDTPLAQPQSTQQASSNTPSLQPPMQLGGLSLVSPPVVGSLQFQMPPGSPFSENFCQGGVLQNRNSPRQLGYSIRSMMEKKRCEDDVLNAVAKLRNQNILSFQSPQANERQCNHEQLQLFSKIIVDAAIYLHQLTGIPTLGIVFSILCIISMVSWGRYKIKVRPRWLEAQIDYGILVCPSGSRKSALCAALRKPFEDFTQTLPEKDNSSLMLEFHSITKEYNYRLRKHKLASLPLQEPNPKILSDLHAVAKESASWKKITAELSKIKRALVSASSQLALIKSMSLSGGCLAILEEEGFMLCSDAVLGKDNPVALLKGHTMETIQYDSVKQGTIVVQNAALPQLHIVQNDVLTRLHSKQYLRKLGVLARYQTFIVHNTERAYPTVNDEAGEIALEALQENVFNILTEHHTNAFPRRLEELQVSAEALAVAEEFEAQTGTWAEQTPNDDLRAYLNKLHGQAVRFAADLHIFNNHGKACETSITSQEMLAGVAMAQELRHHAEVLYAPNGIMAHEHSKLILEWIKGWGEKAGRFRLNLNESWYCFTASEAQQGIRELKSDVRKVWAALDVLEASGYIAQVQTGKNTRLCVLNPRIW